MSLLNRRPASRPELLARAADALGKGKKKKALMLYEQALALQPDDPDVHRRLAPLLAERGRADEAWTSYQRTGEHLRAQGHASKASSLYRQAAGLMPRRPEIWERIAEVELERDRPDEAARALLEGSRHFKKHRDARARLRLLRRARKFDPHGFDVGFEVAQLLARTGDRSAAREVLRHLEPHVQGRELRRVRGLLFRLSATPGAGWRWLRAAFGGA